MKEKVFKIDESEKAFLNLVIYPSGIACLDEIFVPKEERNQGYGTNLVRKALSYLKEKGYDKVTVYFYTDMAIDMTFKIAEEIGIRVLPRFCVVKDDNFYPIRYRTKKEMKIVIQDFLDEHGYETMLDIPEKIFIKNFGKRELYVRSFM